MSRINTPAIAGSALATAIAFTAVPTGAHAQTCDALIALGAAVNSIKCVKGPDIGFGAINSGRIADGAVKTEDLRDDSVTAAKIAADAVGASEIAPNAVGASEIAPNAVGSSELGPNSVFSIDIVNGQVTGDDIANETVTSADVDNNSLRDFDILDEPGVDFSSGNQSLALSSTDVTARSVTVTAPTSGYVICNASGYMFQDDAGRDVGRCSITSGTTLDFTHLIFSENNVSGRHSDAFGATRVFTVGAGSFVCRLVCDEFDGTVTLADSSLNAIFVPTRY